VKENINKWPSGWIVVESLVKRRGILSCFTVKLWINVSATPSFHSRDLTTYESTRPSGMRARDEWSDRGLRYRKIEKGEERESELRKSEREKRLPGPEIAVHPFWPLLILVSLRWRCIKSVSFECKHSMKQDRMRKQAMKAKEIQHDCDKFKFVVFDRSNLFISRLG